MRARRAGQAPPSNVPSVSRPSYLFLCQNTSFLCQAATGRRRPGSPTRAGDAGLGQERDICKSPPPLPWPFGPHVVGYQIQDDTNTRAGSMTHSG